MKSLYSIIAVFIFTTYSYAEQDLAVQGLSNQAKLPNRILETLIAREGGYAIVYPDDKSGIETSETKLHAEIISGERDLMWTLTSKTHEDKFQAVYIPLYRGLIGMRISIVKAQNRDLFKQVSSLQELQRFKAGQGLMWADTKILESNQLQVVKELKYLNLFPMLEGGRFDYFPRGLPEPFSEIEREAKYNLIVEPHLLIKYIAPFYFFVRKGNTELHDYLKNGLENMIADGTYEKLFFDDPQVKQALTLTNVKQRKVIDLTNPNLTPQTPTQRKELWFDPINDKF